MAIFLNNNQPDSIKFNNNDITAAYYNNNLIWPGFSATGGTITTYTSGGIDYTVHSFTSTGTGSFAVTGTGEIDYLVVGGGGSGGVGPGGGGGGSGAVQVGTMQISTGTYTVVVGGSDQQSQLLGSGISNITRLGNSGGPRGATLGTPTPTNGNNGGQIVIGSGGTPISGVSANTAQAFTNGGGGGGAGGDVSSRTPNGKNGLSTNIRTGTNVTYGGGGGARSAGIGGTGGGGNGYNNLTNAQPTAGAANTGGGGGGGRTTTPGLSGGSGIVVIRYRSS